MSNPIFDAMRGSAPMPGGRNMWSLFQAFRQSVQGNPQQLVQQLLSSGRMSQEQFQQFGQMASNILGKK